MLQSGVVDLWGIWNGSVIADRSTSNSTASSKHAYSNLTLSLHLQTDAMVLMNLFSNYSQVSGRSATQEEQNTDTAVVFELAYKHLAGYRNICQVYHVRAYEKQNPEIDAWANDLLKTIWTATTTRNPGWYRVRCGLRLNRSGLITNHPLPEQCPKIEYDVDITTSPQALPPKPELDKILTTIVLIHISAAKGYSARTRACLPGIGTVDESAIVHTLRNPDDVLEKAQKEADATREEQANASALWRKAGIAVGAVAGGVLIGVTGGLGMSSP